jgi:glyoxylase-like metal-dependent hydrolase (beta-lactamase superfamily II)
MTAIRRPGKINQDTTLIDIGMHGTYGLTAVYLVQAARSCLIDGGTRREAGRLLKALRRLDAFPPDLIIVTHPHWDHIQGIPLLREEAARQGKTIQLVASEGAVPLLADASFNEIFGHGPHPSIRDVTPIRAGDALDLGGLALRIYDAPGHCPGAIAILDEENRNLFVGDSLGVKVSDDLFLPPFVPPCWDPEAFRSSVERLSTVPYDTLCLAHFGCIGGSEARTILHESEEVCSAWWEWFGRHADGLGDIGALLRAMRAEMKPGIPVLRPVSLGLRVALGLMTAVGTVTGSKTAMIDRLAFGDMVRWLATGYRMYTAG